MEHQSTTSREESSSFEQQQQHQPSDLHHVNINTDDPIETDDISFSQWTIKETTLLLELASKDEDWDIIAKQFTAAGDGKTSQQCYEWFDYLENISKNFPKRQKTKSNSQNGGPHRKRRKAAQIERLYKCQEKYCYRSYGTEGALKMHIKLKHPTVTYNENYQQQARNAAIIAQNLEAAEAAYDEEGGSDIEEVGPPTSNTTTTQQTPSSASQQLSQQTGPSSQTQNSLHCVTVTPPKKRLTVPPVNFSVDVTPLPTKTMSLKSSKKLPLSSVPGSVPGLFGKRNSNNQMKKSSEFLPQIDTTLNPITQNNNNSELSGSMDIEGFTNNNCDQLRRQNAARMDFLTKSDQFNPMQINFICK